MTRWIATARAGVGVSIMVLAACGGGDPDPMSMGAGAQHAALFPDAPLGAVAKVQSASPQAATAPRVPDATAIMDWAETAYTQFFPSRRATSTHEQYVYRYYPETRNYLGVAGDEVYVLGPLSGHVLLYVGSLADFACDVYPQDCPPTIVQQPRNTSVRSGEGVTFSVVASGAGPLHYLWQLSFFEGAPFYDIEGATSPTLTAPVVNASDTGKRVRVVVGNRDEAVTSDPATLTVDAFVSPPGARLAAAIGHGAALRSDGTVVVWGNNTERLLAPSAAATLTSPTPVPGLDNVRSVAGGGSGGASMTFALRADGTVWSWGQNQNGALGDGSGVVRRTAPQPIPGLSRVIAIAAGSSSVGTTTAYALRSDGTVWAWGAGGDGQLGIGELVNAQPTPVQVTGLSNVVSIAAQDGLAFALRDDGRVFGWGQGVNLTLPHVWPAAGGRLLVPTLIAEVPSAIGIGGASNAVYVFEGSGRRLLAWGNNVNGKLGTGTFATVVAGPAEVVAPVESSGRPELFGGVRGCSLFSVGWSDSGLAYAWGQNTALAPWLGDPTLTERRNQPHRVPSLDQVVEATCSMGGSPFIMVRRANGDVLTWGANNSGQLADGTSGNLAARYLPRRVFSLD